MREQDILYEIQVCESILEKYRKLYVKAKCDLTCAKTKLVDYLIAKKKEEKVLAEKHLVETT